MKQKSFELICCPDCHGTLEMESPPSVPQAEEQLYCEECDVYYPIVAGIPDFLKEEHVGESVHKRSYQKTGTLLSALEAKTYEYNAKYLVGLVFGGGALNYVRNAVKPTAQALRMQEGDVALDIACGTGLLARMVAPTVGETGFVVGLDISIDRLKCAETYAEREGLHNVDLMKGDAEYLPYKTAVFDKVALCGAFSGFPNPEKSLNEIKRVLKKDGILSLAAFCNNQSVHVRVLRKFLDKVFKRYREVNWFEREELVGLIENAGFMNIEYEYLGGAFCTVTCRK